MVIEYRYGVMLMKKTTGVPTDKDASFDEIRIFNGYMKEKKRVKLLNHATGLQIKL